MKIKIAHEAPISILDTVAQHTDYSYALVHLFEEHPKYFEFFQKELEKGREVILDNSIFELGEAFNAERYAYWIERLKPTYYVIPDSLENAIVTKMKAGDWMYKYSDLPGKKIGVVQGKTYQEIVDCYQWLDEEIGVDKIAISFDYSYYLRMCNVQFLKLSKQQELAAWMLGRISLLEMMLRDGIINKEKPHHLLGASLAQEFLHYKDREKWGWIYSLDTSNPVVAGLQGVSYDAYNGLSSKPSMKLFELIKCIPESSQMEKVLLNIEQFKNNV